METNKKLTGLKTLSQIASTSMNRKKSYDADKRQVWLSDHFFSKTK